jgi:hypothetical protein
MLPLGPEGLRILRERQPNPMVFKHGSGPEGKRCKTCQHLVSQSIRTNRVYWKCERRSLSHCTASDHRQKWDACRLYEEES